MGPCGLALGAAADLALHPSVALAGGPLCVERGTVTRADLQTPGQ